MSLSGISKIALYIVGYNWQNNRWHCESDAKKSDLELSEMKRRHYKGESLHDD